MKKRTIFLLSMMMIFIFGMQSCNKESLQNDMNIESNILRSRNALNKSRNALNNYAFTTKGVSITNGMLNFKDSVVLRKVMESLESLNKDSVFMDNYLSELGLNRSDYLDNAYPWNPAFQKFNDRLGFNSLGMAEEQREKQFLKDGGNPSNFSDHFIGSDIQKYLLNEDMEVRIGPDILKVVNSKLMFLVLDNDLNALDILRNSSDLSLQRNLKNVLRFNRDILEERNRYGGHIGKKHADDGTKGEFGEPDCQVFLQKELMKEDIYRIYSEVLEGFGINYNWMVTNASGELVMDSDQPGFIDFVQPDPDSGPYTISLTVDILDEFRNVVCTKTVEIELSFPTVDPCEYLNGQLTASGDVDGWKFDLYIPNSVNYALHWDFGDGTILDGDYYNNHLATHDYDDNEIGDFGFYVCVTITDNTNDCEKTICRYISSGCGLQVSDPPPKYKEWKIGEEMVKYKLVTRHSWTTGGWDRLKAKLKNYHRYHTWILDFWWYKPPAYQFIEFRLNPVYVNCDPEYRNPPGGLNQEEVEFLFDPTDDNDFTHVVGGSYSNNWVGDGDQVYGPFYIAWRE